MYQKVAARVAQVWTGPQLPVPHLRDSLTVAKVGSSPPQARHRMQGSPTNLSALPWRIHPTQFDKLKISNRLPAEKQHGSSTTPGARKFEVRT